MKRVARLWRVDFFFAVLLDPIGDVLNQLAAHHHIQNLNTAADTEDRPTHVKKLVDEFFFQYIAVGHYIASFRMRLLTVARGIHVAAAGQQQRAILAEVLRQIVVRSEKNRLDAVRAQPMIVGFRHVISHQCFCRQPFHLFFLFPPLIRAEHTTGEAFFPRLGKKQRAGFQGLEIGPPFYAIKRDYFDAACSVFLSATLALPLSSGFALGASGT